MSEWLSIVGAVGAIGYVVIVELAPLPQIIKLHATKESDQVSILFTVALALGRLLGLPYIFEKQAHIMFWGIAVGALLRIILLFQTYYYQRRYNRLKSLRETEVTI